MAYCPERVLPGHVLRELVQNDRVIGGMTPKCSEAAARLYKIFVQGECVVTNARTAEMCKLTENSFRDVNIAFANELSIICNKLGINVWELIKLANGHPRVNILQPGPGVGARRHFRWRGGLYFVAFAGSRDAGCASGGEPRRRVG